jgi:hypothetical protein
LRKRTRVSAGVVGVWLEDSILEALRNIDDLSSAADNIPEYLLRPTSMYKPRNSN